jgi:TetR/AcrR family transcriptional regulator, transcriptional repressor of bet genes
MPRRPNTESRRAQIVQAFMPVLARSGYGKATVVEIARQAGLAPGLIHYHFANKREILVSLVNAMVEHAQARFEQLLAQGHGPEARLRAYLDARLALGDGADADLAAAWVMVGAEAVREPEVREVYQRAVSADLAQLTGLLTDCLVHQKREPSSATPLACALLAMMEGAFQLSCATREVMPRGYAAQAAWDCARLGIEAAEPLGRQKN